MKFYVVICNICHTYIYIFPRSNIFYKLLVHQHIAIKTSLKFEKSREIQDLNPEIWIQIKFGLFIEFQLDRQMKREKKRSKSTNERWISKIKRALIHSSEITRGSFILLFQFFRFIFNFLLSCRALNFNFTTVDRFAEKSSKARRRNGGILSSIKSENRGDSRGGVVMDIPIIASTNNFTHRVVRVPGDVCRDTSAQSNHNWFNYQCTWTCVEYLSLLLA